MKIAGIILIICSCTLLGWQQASHYPKRIRQLRQLQTAFNLLATEITYSLTPLPVALKRVCSQVEPWLEDFFQGIVSAMTEEKLLLAEAWDKAELRLAQTDLTAEDILLLRESCVNLGQGDAVAQEKTLALLQQRLEYNLGEALAEGRQKEQLWRYLGVSAGAVLVIILI